MNVLLLFYFVCLLLFTCSAFKFRDNNSCYNVSDYYHTQGNPNCFYNEDFQLSVPELVKKYTGRDPEAYRLTTDDGYIITMFRILRNNPKGVVLLVHPIISNSLSYVVLGNKSLAITLWNAGYDVWLNNQRGTEFSEEHTKYVIQDYEYWNWTFHEVALYEMPKQVELIRNKTNNQKIIFYGHSLGTTIGLLYATLFPKEAEEQFKVFILAGMTCYYKNNKGAVTGIAKLGKGMQLLTTFFKLGFVVPLRHIIAPLGQIITRKYPFVLEIGALWAKAFNGGDNVLDPANVSPDLINVLHNFSFKMVYHLFQFMNAETHFQYYDYGPVGNLKQYGTERAPYYPIENITAPIYLVYSTHDELTTPKDTMLLYNQLPDRAKKYGIMEVKRLSHIDYFFAANVTGLFFQPLLKFINSLP